MNQVPDEFQLIVQECVTKGIRAKPTVCLGDSSSFETESTMPADNIVEGQNVSQGAQPLKFRSKEKFCVVFALGNLLNLSKNKTRALLRQEGLRTHTSLSDFSLTASRVIGITLQRKSVPQDLLWLCEQRSGKFLVSCGVHVVGVDCAAMRLYDCGQANTLVLSLSSLRRVGITPEATLQIRRVHESGKSE